jgi:Tfp pilus assembly protein PilW
MTQLTRQQARTLQRTAFTITEMIVGSAIGMILLAAILTTFSVTTRNFKAAANYGQIHREGRYAVDTFAREFRAATTITNVTTNSISLIVPTDFNSQGTATTTLNVRYYQNGAKFHRQVTSTGATATLCSNVTTVTFSLYDRLGQYTSDRSKAKGCQVDIKLRKTVAGTAQTEDFLSARLTLRNKP